MPKFSRIGLVIVIIGTASSAVSALETPLTLPAAVELATSQSPELEGRRAAVQAAEAVLESAGELPDPELVMGLDNVPATGSLAYSLSRDEFTGRKIGVMQQFPARHKLELRRQRAADEARVMQAQRVTDELNIKRDAALSWIAAYVAEEKLRQLQALAPAMQLQARIAVADGSNPRSASADTLSAQAALIEFQDRLQVAQQAAKRSRLELQRWLPQDAHRPLADPPRFDQLSVPVGQLLSGIHDHASLRTFDARLQAAQTDIALAQADKRPDWSVELDYANRAAPFSDMVTLEFKVGLPLFASRRQDPVIAGRHAQLHQVEAERENETRMHAAELAQDIADWRTLQARVATYEGELIPLAQARSRAAMAAFQSASTTLKTVLEAHAAEIDVQLVAVEIRGLLGSAWARLNYLQDQKGAP